MAALSLLFMLAQLLGVRYVDWLAEFVPHALLVQDYVISYPIVYGSPLYKSNAWLALEPSFLSFMIGACVVAALIVRMSVAKVLILIAGLLSTVAGSGIAVVVGYLLGLIVVRRIAALRKYAVPAALLIAGFCDDRLRRGHHPALLGGRRSQVLDRAAGDRTVRPAVAALDRRPDKHPCRAGSGVVGGDRTEPPDRGPARSERGQGDLRLRAGRRRRPDHLDDLHLSPQP